MKKKLLRKIKELIKNQIKQTQNKQKDWIDGDDKRYTKILAKHNKNLSSLWKKTKNFYLRKVKTKQLIQIDDAPEDYSDPQYDSSNYIDTALEILAFAFGEGVLVGYKELDKRGLLVEIPENPHTFFDQAKEIKNYAHAALSYEQNQMEEIFDLYNKTEDAKQKIKDWFDKNEYRLTDLMLGGVVWYAIQFGFSRAIIETQGDEEDNLVLYWLSEHDSKVCDDCRDLEAGNPYSKKKPLPTLPGGGKTICGSKCRCVIDIQSRN